MYTAARDPLLLPHETHTLNGLSLDQLYSKREKQSLLLCLNLVLEEADHVTAQQIRLWLHLSAY